MTASIKPSVDRRASASGELVCSPGQYTEAGKSRATSVCRIVLVALLIVGLAGCAGSPTPMSRYNLPFGEPQTTTQAQAPAQTIAVEPIQLARYLRHDGILMQLSDIELRHADNHLWAEPLERQLDRVLRRRLEQALADTRVLRNRSEAVPEQADYRLSVDIDRFQGRHDGTAVVGGEWEIRNSEGERVAQRIFLAEEPLESDGYPALVRSLGRAWQQSIDEMTEALEARFDEDEADR